MTIIYIQTTVQAPKCVEKPLSTRARIPIRSDGVVLGALVCIKVPIYKSVYVRVQPICSLQSMRLERYTRAIAAIRLFPRRGLSHLYLCMPIARVSRAAVHFSLAAAVRSRASVEDVWQ